MSTKKKLHGNYKSYFDENGKLVRECYDCKRVFPANLSYFHKDGKHLKPRCKPCNLLNRRKYYYAKESKEAREQARKRKEELEVKDILPSPLQV